MTVWYRYEDIKGPKIFLVKYKVIKTTPQGVRLRDFSKQGRLVLNDSVKKWAAPTIEEAWKCFMARKRSQWSHVSRYHSHCERLMGALTDCKSFEDFVEPEREDEEWELLL